MCEECRRANENVPEEIKEALKRQGIDISNTRVTMQPFEEFMSDQIATSYGEGMKTVLWSLDSILYDPQIAHDELPVILHYLSQKMSELLERIETGDLHPSQQLSELDLEKDSLDREELLKTLFEMREVRRKSE